MSEINSMKPTDCVVATLNVTPMDREGNLAKINAILDEVRLACLPFRRPVILFPELTLTGHCGDFFCSQSLCSWAMDDLFSLLPKTDGLIAAIGLPLKVNNQCYNAMAILADREICGFAFLSNESKRDGFASGLGLSAVTVRRRSYPVTSKYGFGGTELLIHTGGKMSVSGTEPSGRLVLCPRVEPFILNGRRLWEESFVKASAVRNDFFVSADYSGNESGQLIYAGRSLLAYCGRMLRRGRLFSYRPSSFFRQPLDDLPLSAESLGDFGAWESADGEELSFEEFSRSIALGLFDYLRKSHAGGFTLSLSGGADSAAIAVLIRLMVLFGCRELGVWSFLRALSSVSGIRALLDEAKNVEPDEKRIVAALLTTAYQATANSSEVTRRSAKRVAEAVGSVHFELEVDSLVESYKGLISEALGRPLSWKTDDLALQNIQARVRGPGIWLLANLTGSLLLSTGNRSEASVGYATMDGDTCGCLSPIGSVSKAFLRRWLVWLETTGVLLERTLDGGEVRFSVPELSYVNAQQPTAELRPPTTCQTDESDLMPYIVLDVIERGAAVEKHTGRALLNFVRAELREGSEQYSDEQLWDWIQKYARRFAASQWKRFRSAPAFCVDQYDLTDCCLPLLTGEFKLDE